MEFWECFGNKMGKEVTDTHIYGPLFFSASTYYTPLLVRHMGDHYTQDIGLCGCVLIGMDIANSLNFT